MGEEEKLVECRNVSKVFCRNLKRSLWYGVKDVAADLLPGIGGQKFVSDAEGENVGEAVLRRDEFFALNDVSFSLARGDRLGVVGHNGAGKTTLLKLLCGLIKPDSGSISMQGRVGSLIALGSGFNPVLSGRENIFVQGAILGLRSKEIKAKLDEIVDFAEVRDSIDSPVRNYSSGMQVRLGFAVSALLIDPDILILDEVLAVGDADFKRKCFSKIEAITKDAAVILVSHNSIDIQRVCNRIIMIEGGKKKLDSLNVVHSMKVYESSLNDREFGEIRGQDRIEVAGVEVGGSFLSDKPEDNVFDSDAEVDVEMSLKFHDKFEEIVVTASIYRRLDRPEVAYHSDTIDVSGVDSVKLSASLGKLGLASGIYFVRVTVHTAGWPNSGRMISNHEGHFTLTFQNASPLQFAVCHPEANWKIER